jgi:hypothetical protein
MRLQALSTGTGVPCGRFAGVVHSVFRQACNLRTDDGSLLTLLAPQLGNAPHGIRVAAPPKLAFSDHLRPGQRVGCRAAVLRVAGADFAVDLAGAERWQSGLETLATDLGRPEVALAWQVAWQALAHERRRRADPLTEAVDARGLALARAGRALSTPEAALAIRALIGCGPGLTPAGDDLIVGLLAGLWSTRGDDPARRRFLEGLAVIVTATAEATGEISRAYLQHATRGSVAEPLATLAARIAEGASAAAIERASTAALCVGHTSGGDAVLGLLLGLTCWSDREPGHG